MVWQILLHCLFKCFAIVHWVTGRAFGRKYLTPSDLWDSWPNLEQIDQ